MSLMYQVCLRTIARGSYPDDLAARMELFHANGLMTDQEYRQLVDLLAAA